MNTTITKRDLAQILARELNCQMTQAKQFVDIFFEVMTDTIIQGNRIEARGFGVWEVKETNPKPHARNPKTGEQIRVPARRKVLFRPGKMLKDRLSRPLENEDET